MVNQKHKRKSEEGLTAAPSSSSMANSFFLTVFSWVLMLNSEACRSEVRGQTSNQFTKSIAKSPHLLLQLCKLVLILGNLLQGWFDAGKSVRRARYN